VTYPHKDTVVISMVLANHRVHMILVDYDSFVNILSIDVISYIGIDPSKMTHVKTLLIGTKGSRVPIKGCLRDFCHDQHVLKVPYPSTNLYGDKHDFSLQYLNKRPLLHQINAVIKHAILSFEN